MKIQELTSVPIIPVLRKLPYEKNISVIQSLINAGIKTIEITMDSEQAADMIREAKLTFGDQISIGAGTVMTKEDADSAIAAGVEFIVAPHLDEKIVRYVISKDILMIPGVFSPSEIVQAIQLGVKMVKLFPSSVLGPQFIKDIKGPLEQLSIMCTGGLTKLNASSYLSSGAIAVGAGSALLKRDYITNNDWSGLEEEAKAWLTEVKDYIR